MSNDIFKSLVKSSPDSLIDGGDFKIQTGENINKGEPLRRGIGGHNASDIISDQLRKGGAFGLAMPMNLQRERVSRHAEDIGPAEGKQIVNDMSADERFKQQTTEDYSINLENTHGENWHTDNDKMVADHQKRIHEADSQFGPEERPAKSKRMSVPPQTDEMGEKEYTYRSLTSEELFLKAMDVGDFFEERLEKGHFKNMAIDEQEKQDFESKVEKKREKLKNKKTKWLQDFSAGKKKKDVNAFMDKQDKGKKEADDQHHKDTKVDVVGMDKKGRRYTSRSGSPGNYKYVYAKSELDEMFDLIKGEDAEEKKEKKLGNKIADAVDEMAEGEAQEEMKDHEKEMHKKKSCGAKKSFVKSSGPGGMVFDFGHRTGNPIADMTTDLLNRHGDPTQSAVANDQQMATDRAVTEYVEKGDGEFTAERSDSTGDGSVHKGWDLDTPMDKQVENAYAQEKLDKSVETPAVTNDFNETTMNLDGQIIKATSETDAQLIKEMQRQGIDLSGVFAKGEVVADARMGGATSICAGDPLPQELVAE
jgi:hypothetical protein